MMRRASIRLRLALWSAGTVGLVLVLFAAAVFAAVKALLVERSRAQLEAHLARVAAIAREEPNDFAELAEELAEESGVELFAVAVAGGRAVASEAWVRAGLPGADAAQPAGGRYRIGVRDDRYGGSRAHFAAAVDDEPMRADLRGLAAILLVLLPCALGFALLGGWWLAGRLLAPVEALLVGAERITAERLGERLPVANPADEFGRLASAFNGVLQRLQDAFDRLRRFTADASHELRTPLAALRAVGEVALREDADAARARDAIGSMLEEADRLAVLVDRLLTLTRADAGAHRARFEPIDLGEFARATAEWLRPWAEERGVALEVAVDGPVPVAGDVAALREALVNVLDNGLRYTPPGGRVEVACRIEGDRACVEVRDNGPGIAAEHQARVFDRFYRVDGRERGTGLGLAIAKWAVELHGGRIELESELGSGSTFRIALPLSRAP